MQITNTHKIILGVLIVAILFGAYFIFDKKSKEETDNKPVDLADIATTTEKGMNGLKYTIEKIEPNQPTQSSEPMPDLNRLVIKSPLAKVSEIDTIRFAEKIKYYQSLLQKNPTDLPSWMNLSSYQILAGDYDGAVLSLRYVSKIFPKDYIALGNLGNLYAYYMKDNGQAELAYLEAISRAPTQSYLYYQLSKVYIDVFKDAGKARAIIDQGLSKIPNDPVLTEMKKSLE